jgi:hypothetical protein
VLSLSDVLHFLAHEFSGLGRRRFAFRFVAASPLHRSLLWHDDLLPFRTLMHDVRAQYNRSTDRRGKQFVGWSKQASARIVRSSKRLR